MANVAAARMIEAATEALRRGDARRTLEIADQALRIDESIAQGHQLRGIALTRLGNVEEATIALRRATEVAPYDPKHFYNLAVNLRDRNLKDEAESMAHEALRIDPNHQGAQRLLHELNGTEMPDAEAAETGEAPEVRPGYEPPKHLLPFMYGFERTWDGIGLGFMAVGLLLAVTLIFNMPMGPTAKAVPHGQLPDIQLKRDALSLVQQFLYVFSLICTFMWMLIDIVDRRRRFTWFVPLTVCGTFGFSVLPLALYYFLGRKLESDGVSKS